MDRVMFVSSAVTVMSSARRWLLGARIPAILFAALVLVMQALLASPGHAVSLVPEPVSVTNNTSLSSTLSYHFSQAYAGGPYDGAAVTVGGTLGDRSGDGASLSGSFSAGVGATPSTTPIVTIPLNVSIGAGTAGTIETVPSGAGPATSMTTDVSATDWSSLSGDFHQRVKFTLSGDGDMATLVTTATLSGGASQSPLQLFNVVAQQNLTGGATTFTYDFSTPGISRVPGAYETLSVGILGAFMDAGGDGASLTDLEVRTFVGTTEFTDALITSSALSALNLFDIRSFPGGQAFPSPTALTGLTTPSSGYMSIDLSFTLTGNGDAASLMTGFELSRSQAQPVPEPTTLLLLGSGLVGLAGYGRKRKK